MPIAIVLTAALGLASVLVHYEVLQRVGQLRQRLSLPGRLELLLLSAAAVFAHLVVICLYAAAFAWMHRHPELGALAGHTDAAGADFFYFSVACYTTLGFGDIYATGPMRIMAALEGLNGLVLITWSASFAFASTANLWRRD